MVHRRGAHDLMLLVVNLTYLYERSRSVSEIRPAQKVSVKGESCIFSVLTNEYPFIESLSKTYPSLIEVRNSVRDWIAYLDKMYPDEEPPFGPANYLQREDAIRLAKDSLTWTHSILGAYAEPGTVLIREESLNLVLPKNLFSSLDDVTREDLYDALICIFHLIPTPAAMISFRAAENIVRSYYAKVTGKPSTNKTWAEILKELELNPSVKKTLVGYLDYLRDKRNEAEHPDKRFTQEEAERVFLQVKGLVEETR